ncbi:Long-chain-fatty-acid--CoA ligase [Entamoeba marina]
MTYNKSYSHIENGMFYFDSPKHSLGGMGEDVKEFLQTHTSYEIIKHRCETTPESDMFGYRLKEGNKSIGEYIWMNSKDGLELIDNFASGFMTKYPLEKGKFVGFVGRNRYEWYVAQIALQRHGIVPVPFYASLGKKGIDYIIDTLDIKHILCTYSDAVVDLAQRKESLHFICYDKPCPNDWIKATYFSDLVSLGKESYIPPRLPSMNDTCIVIFTSGTQGIPKGGVHTFASVSHAVISINDASCFKNAPIHNETFFSYLPSAHVLDQQIATAFLYDGGRVGFISGGISMFVEDMKLCKPTYIAAVPRVMQKIYDKFKETYNEMGYIKQAIYNTAYYFKRNAVINNSWNYINWDNVVFHQIHEQFGGHLKFVFDGGAPLTTDLYEWLRVCSGAFIMQGYGMTETYGGCISCLPGSNDANVLSCGFPCSGVNCRLVDVPEMQYVVDSSFPSGELQIKSPLIFKEYYKNEEATTAAFTADGFFCTGDIATVGIDGSLSQGEYIAVEPLEGIYETCDIINQIFIYGESTDNFIVAIVIVEPSQVKRLIEGSGMKCTNEEEAITMMNEKDVKMMLLKHIEDFLREQKVSGFKIIKNGFFDNTPFTTENDLLTPSFKIKRFNIKKKYSNELQQLRQEVINN